MNNYKRAPKQNTSIAPQQSVTPLKKTDWDSVAQWYTKYLQEDTDSYHAKVIVPNLMRLLGDLEGKKILDVGCGDGSIATIISEKAKLVDAFDGSTFLINEAKKKKGKVNFFVHDARLPISQKHGVYDHVICILAIQNIDNLHAVCKNIADALPSGASFSIVTSHPAFRVPQESDWYYSDARKAQGRVVYNYLSEKKITIALEPSKKNSAHTYTFHRPLQVYMKCLSNAGFMIRRMEEWTSHKASEKGPRRAAEDQARLEIPMFLYLEAVKV